MIQALKPVVSLAYITVLAMIRGRLLIFSLAGLLLIGLVAYFIAQLTLADTLATQTAIAAYLVRLFLMLLVAVFMAISTANDTSSKWLELLLAGSLSPTQYISGKLLAGISFAKILVLPVMLLAFFYAPQPWGGIGWGITLIGELSLVAAVALFFSISIRQTPIALSMIFAFYLLARTIEQIRLITINVATTESARLIHYILDAIAWLLPDLGRFAKTEWLVYAAPTWSEIGQVALQTFIYLGLIIAAATWDLYHRKF